MMWYVPVILEILIGFGFARYLMKKCTDTCDREHYFLLQYACCASIAFLVAAFLGQISFSKTAIAIMALGVINALATYCQWRAMALSMSKTSLFTMWDDLIAMFLSYSILREGRFFNPRLAAGVGISLLAIGLFVRKDYKDKPAEKHSPSRLYAYILAYSVIWGVASFLMRLWAVNNVPPGTFLFGWYSGSFIGALAVYKLCSPPPATRPFPVLLKRTLPLSLAIVGSLALEFWAYSLAPLVVVQPIFLVAEIIVPTLIGLWIFKERKNLGLNGWLYFALGIGGALITALSWR